MADEALQQEVEQEELTEVELPESEEEMEEAVVEEVETEEQPKKEAKSDTDEIEEYSEGVKKRIAKLTYKVREAERREQAAVDYAKSVQEELNTTKNKLSKTDQNLYAEYKGRVGSELTAAQDRYKRAYEAGDTDAMLEAQKDVAKLAVEEESLNRVKKEEPTETEQKVDVEKAIEEKVQPQQQIQPDPKAQEWAKRNDWFGNDVAMTTSAFAFHRQLVEQEGYDPTSDDYYAEVDRRLAEAFPHKLGKTQQNTVNEVVAGSSRGSTTARTRSRRKVQLTPSQVAIAKRLGVPLEEYAKHIKE